MGVHRSGGPSILKTKSWCTIELQNAAMIRNMLRSIGTTNCGQPLRYSTDNLHSNLRSTATTMWQIAMKFRRQLSRLFAENRYGITLMIVAYCLVGAVRQKHCSCPDTNMSLYSI